MVTPHTILLAAAVVFFALEAATVPTGRLGKLGAGLLCLTLAQFFRL